MGQGPAIMGQVPAHRDGQVARLGLEPLPPFAGTRERIGGYGVIDGAGLDAAVQVAAGHPLARVAAVEVRPCWDAPWDH